MSINIDGSLNNASISTTGPKARNESDVPFPYVTEDGVLKGVEPKKLPEGFGMTSEQLIADIESKTAKIVYEFGSDGSVRIKPGLSQYDYMRALDGLREMQMWRQGK